MSDTPAYVVGQPHPNTNPRPTFEFKAPSPDHTGGGYPRVRSTEYRPETSRQGKEDVFVPVHRLAAVAWHLPDGTLGDDVRLSQLDGMDVHHVTPDGGAGMPAANGEDWTELIGHGDHSAVTQAERRAWAADEQRARDGQVRVDAEPCVECGGDPDEGVSVPSVDGPLCLGCAMELGKERGETVEL
jgi:hypothetical protein